MSKDDENKIKNYLKSDSFVKGLFITSIASISAIVSFSYALSSTKKRDPSVFDCNTVELYESATKLAFRALKWGTFYAVTGCGILIFGVWKIAAINNIKLSSIIPPIPKNFPPQSRTEFKTVTEFMQYLDDEFSSKTYGSSKTDINDERSA